jgi:hypothetical protein
MRFAVPGSALIAGTLLLALTGCSSDHKSAPAKAIPAATIQASLLTPTDVGFTGGADEIVPASTDPLPCAAKGSKSVNEQVPASTRSGAVLSSNALQAALSEEVRIYKDEKTAGKALAIFEAGFGCATGHLASDSGEGEALTIQTPQSIATQLEQDPSLSTLKLQSAQVWHAATSEVQLAVIAVQQNRSLLLFTYQTTLGTTDPKLETVADVILEGLKKVVKT